MAATDRLRPVTQLRDAYFRTVIAAEHAPRLFQTMTDDAHTAMLASRRQPVNCAFEAVEGVRPTTLDQLE